MLHPSLHESYEQEHRKIHTLLDSPKPLLVGRLGCGEAVLLTRTIRSTASINAGISPPTDEVLNVFRREYSNAIRRADIMALFNATYIANERSVISQYNKTCAFTERRMYENLLTPARSDFHWLRALEGKRVLVVSPFTESIEAQYASKRDDLFPDVKYPQFQSLRVGDSKEITDLFYKEAVKYLPMNSKCDNKAFDEFFELF